MADSKESFEFIPRRGALIKAPGKGNDRGITAAIRALQPGECCYVEGTGRSAATIAIELFGKGNVASRKTTNGRRIYRLR